MNVHRTFGYAEESIEYPTLLVARIERLFRHIEKIDVSKTIDIEKIDNDVQH